MDAETPKWVAWVVEKLGLPGLIMIAWAWDSYQKNKMINNAFGLYHTTSEATLKSLTQIKMILQLKVVGSLSEGE